MINGIQKLINNVDSLFAYYLYSILLIKSYTVTYMCTPDYK